MNWIIASFFISSVNKPLSWGPVKLFPNSPEQTGITMRFCSCHSTYREKLLTPKKCGYQYQYSKRCCYDGAAHTVDIPASFLPPALTTMVQARLPTALGLFLELEPSLWVCWAGWSARKSNILSLQGVTFNSSWATEVVI